MRTDDLVGLLSTGITPVRRGTAARRFGISLPIAAAWRNGVDGYCVWRSPRSGCRRQDPDLLGEARVPTMPRNRCPDCDRSAGAPRRQGWSRMARHDDTGASRLDRCNHDCRHRGARRPAACDTRALVAVMSVQYSSARRSRLRRHILGRQRSGTHESAVCRCCLRAAREFDRHSRVLLSLP